MFFSLELFGNLNKLTERWFPNSFIVGKSRHLSY